MLHKKRKVDFIFEEMFYIACLLLRRADWPCPTLQQPIRGRAHFA